MIKVIFNKPQEFCQQETWQTALFIECNEIEVFESRRSELNSLKCITTEDDFSLFFLKDIKKIEPLKF